ncbi:MobF family relaxase [Mycolicibacterium llatzerense]|uniref:MobF family relaxase n=1 Tax=Mycolicibacterium llatzerense TaxID=280871 RepID=UPI0008DCC27F|nr:MobF family relaxase [Mycolicibacterium llatzerense]
MLTISRLSRWSINYYETTANEARQSAMNRQAANGGLGEYYSEGDTRMPTWLVVGDVARVAELTGLTGSDLAGGEVAPGAATTWLDDGVAPNGSTGRVFTKESVHGFDLTFAAPKSVSLVRGLTSDLNEKVIAEAHKRAITAALDYLRQHAGYTRVHNPRTGKKDLQRLPGLVAIAYQHETSRCGDPHLHTHVIVPNRQARTDGRLVSIDSKSLLHEAKAAGIVYQATLRRELHVERGFEWVAVGERTGMAEIAGVTRDCVAAWSQRSTRLREWARRNLVVVDGEPTTQQLAVAQRATRPLKPEALSWAQLKEQWRADARGLVIDRAVHDQARAERVAAPRLLIDRARLARLIEEVDKPVATRADLVELVGALLPVDAPGEPRVLIEQIVDTVAVQISPPRERHHREGHDRFTVDAVIAEEERVLEMVDEADGSARLDVRADDVGDLSDDQTRAIGQIAQSPFLVQPLQAPAGAGKTHSLKALRAGAARAGKEVVVLAPTGKAVDEAMRDGAGDRGLTVARALSLIADDELRVDRRTVLVVDEASMVGTPALKKLLACAVVGRAKIVLVGDAYQLAPVRARGGMFEQLCADLPWSQQLGEVWRMRTVEERDMSLALRSGRGNRLRTAVAWYRNNGRLHTGDPIAMAQDATEAYIGARAAGKDAAIICDTWEIADAINLRLHDVYTAGRAPAVRVARQQRVCAGDIIVSRSNEARIAVQPGPERGDGDRLDQVRNGNRWRVMGVDADGCRIAAERLTDRARVLFEGDYLREHITVGYATTLHAAQGITVGDARTEGVCFTVLSERASRSMAYVGMTRGKDENHAYIYQPITGEADHQHAPVAAGEQIHRLRRGNRYAAAYYLRAILANDDRPRTMHAEASRTPRQLLPSTVAGLLDRDDRRRAARRRVWRQEIVQAKDRQAAVQRLSTQDPAARSTSRARAADGDGLEF